jgi:hypothetical protein
MLISKAPLSQQTQQTPKTLLSQPRPNLLSLAGVPRSLRAGGYGMYGNYDDYVNQLATSMVKSTTLEACMSWWSGARDDAGQKVTTTIPIRYTHRTCDTCQMMFGYTGTDADEMWLRSGLKIQSQLDQCRKCAGRVDTTVDARVDTNVDASVDTTDSVPTVHSVHTAPTVPTVPTVGTVGTVPTVPTVQTVHSVSTVHPTTSDGGGKVNTDVVVYVPLKFY